MLGLPLCKTLCSILPQLPVARFQGDQNAMPPQHLVWKGLSLFADGCKLFYWFRVAASCTTRNSPYTCGKQEGSQQQAFLMEGCFLRLALQCSSASLREFTTTLEQPARKRGAASGFCVPPPRAHCSFKPPMLNQTCWLQTLLEGLSAGVFGVTKNKAV